jgi:hypothetical protein
MRWSLVVVAGLAGLLLGGAAGAVFTAVVVDAALRLGRAYGSGEDQVYVAELVPAVVVLERGPVGALEELLSGRSLE